MSEGDVRVRVGPADAALPPFFDTTGKPVAVGPGADHVCIVAANEVPGQPTVVLHIDLPTALVRRLALALALADRLAAQASAIQPSEQLERQAADLIHRLGFDSA